MTNRLPMVALVATVAGAFLIGDVGGAVCRPNPERRACRGVPEQPHVERTVSVVTSFGVVGPEAWLPRRVPVAIAQRW